MIELILYSKPGCPLCDEMRTTVSRLLRDDMLLREVDVSSDEILTRKFGHDVPILIYKNQRLAQRIANRFDLEKKISNLRASA